MHVTDSKIYTLGLDEKITVYVATVQRKIRHNTTHKWIITHQIGWIMNRMSEHESHNENKYISSNHRHGICSFCRVWTDILRYCVSIKIIDLFLYNIEPAFDPLFLQFWTCRLNLKMILISYTWRCLSRCVCVGGALVRWINQLH